MHGWEVSNGRVNLSCPDKTNATSAGDRNYHGNRTRGTRGLLEEKKIDNANDGTPAVRMRTKEERKLLRRRDVEVMVGCVDSRNWFWEGFPTGRCDHPKVRGVEK